MADPANEPTLILTQQKPKEISFNRLARFAQQSASPILHAPGEHRFMASHREFGVGDRARVAFGSLEGHEVVIRGFSGDKASFVLEMFGRETLQEMRLDMLEAA